MAAASEGESVGENVLRELAARATKAPEFLRQARKDLEGTLDRYGYHLTGKEMRLVEGLQQQTAGMSDEELAQMLANSLEGLSRVIDVRNTH